MLTQICLYSRPCRLPCLVSEIRGNRELVRLTSGRFALDDKEDFLRKANALLFNTRLMEQNRREMQKQAVKYNSNVVNAKMYQIYQNMRA